MRLPFQALRGTLILAALLLLTLAATPAARSQSIDVGPGSNFGYLPLSAFGTTPLAGMGDETITNIPVPDFVYAGETWNQIGITSNGYVVVGGGTATDVSPTNTVLPNGAAPNNILAPFWTDLDSSLGGSVLANVLTDGVSSWIVIEWEGVPLKGQPSQKNTFQIWIGINGVEDITYAYDALSAPAQLTVGAEEKTGTVGDVAFFNGTGTRPVQGSELRVTTSGLPAPPPDTTAPTVTASANKTALWPPNGKAVPVTVSGSVTDSGSGADRSSGAYTVTDSEGTSIPSGTFTINPDGTYAFTLPLIASRKGTSKDGRVYTITITAKDNAGNTGTATVTVTVPHD